MSGIEAESSRFLPLGTIVLFATWTLFGREGSSPPVPDRGATDMLLCTAALGALVMARRFLKSEPVESFSAFLKAWTQSGVDLISDALPFGQLWYAEIPQRNRLRKVSQPVT